MAIETRVPPALDGPPHDAGGREPSLGELFRQLSHDSTALIRQEVALAKAEMRENFRAIAKDTAKLAIGGGILLVALLVLTAFLVAGLGDLLDDQYWLGALIVGVVYAAVGGLLLMSGRKGLQHDDLRPDRTIATLQEDKRWAQAEVQTLKRDLRS